MTGTLPKRSVRRPDSGESAEHPERVAADDEADRRRASWPCSVMWSGVIVMIRTITTWPVTSATIATGTCGRREHASRSDTAIDASAAGRCRRRLVGERVRVRVAAATRTGSPRPRRRRSGRDTARRARAGRALAAKSPAGADEVRPDDRADRRAPDDRARWPRRAARPGTGPRPRSATAGWSALPNPIRNVPTRSSGNDAAMTAASARIAPDDADRRTRPPGRPGGRGGS